MIFWIHKDLKNKNVKSLSEEEINMLLADGWLPGKCPTHWITNGTDNKLLKEGLPLPAGFYFGQSDEFKKKNSEGGKRRWKNTTEEQRLEISKKVSLGLKAMWSNLTEEEKDLREKRRFNTRSQWTEEEIYNVHLSMSTAAKKNRAKITKEEYHKRSIKSTNTKKKNNSFNTSSYEELCYNELCKAYNKDNVIREYVDNDRYPFNCDFYVKSVDLFIELNIHPSHGSHRFNPENSEDVEQTENLKLENSHWSKMILNVWCVRDVEKCKIAKDNDLNYLTIYSKDFNGFIEELRSKQL